MTTTIITRTVATTVVCPGESRYIESRITRIKESRTFVVVAAAASRVGNPRTSRRKKLFLFGRVEGRGAVRYAFRSETDPPLLTSARAESPGNRFSHIAYLHLGDAEKDASTRRRGFLISAVTRSRSRHRPTRGNITKKFAGLFLSVAEFPLLARAC